MNVTLHRRTALWAAILMLLFVVGAPAVAQGQGRGRGQDKKAGKFKNGHDARDGRWDGRGPQGNRSDRYDDDDYRYNDDDYRYGRNRRTGGNGGTYNRTDIRRQAQSNGYQEGLRAGQDDRARGSSYSLESHNTYRDATAGYNSSYGDIELYRNAFRQGYRQGYDEGYRYGGGRGGRSRVGTILGDILGRP
jgi:hypothetical protein